MRYRIIIINDVSKYILSTFDTHILTLTHTHTHTHTNTRLLRNNNSTKLHQPITHCIKYERKKFTSTSSIRWNKLPPSLRNKNLMINTF